MRGTTVSNKKYAREKKTSMRGVCAEYARDPHKTRVQHHRACCNQKPLFLAGRRQQKRHLMPGVLEPNQEYSKQNWSHSACRHHRTISFLWEVPGKVNLCSTIPCISSMMTVLPAHAPRPSFCHISACTLPRENLEDLQGKTSESDTKDLALAPEAPGGVKPTRKYAQSTCEVGR